MPLLVGIVVTTSHLQKQQQLLAMVFYRLAAAGTCIYKLTNN
jgi:hypothetical protein